MVTPQTINFIRCVYIQTDETVKLAAFLMIKLALLRRFLLFLNFFVFFNVSFETLFVI